MLVLPLHPQAPNVSAHATEPYLKRIHANPVELHRLDNRQNSQICPDDTALTSQFNTTTLRTLVLCHCAQGGLSWQPVKRYMMPSRYLHGFKELTIRQLAHISPAELPITQWEVSARQYNLRPTIMTYRLIDRD